MSLSKLLAQSRIMVPEKSGETLGVIRVPLGVKGQSMRGFGRRFFLPLPGAATVLVPRTELREHRRSALLELSRSTLMPGSFCPAVWN